MATIKDVAEHANVSIATVSRVLNKTRYVSPDVVQRVQKAIKELHYQHNVLARNLRRSQSSTLGVIIPDSNNPFFAEVTRGIEDVCFDQGYVVVLCNTNEDVAKASSYLTTLYQHRVAGLIVVSPGDMTEELQAHVDKGYPIVLVDRPLPRLQVDTIASDNYTGAKMAIEHLLDLGHRRIGLIAVDVSLETFQARRQGALHALEAAGVPLDDTLIYNDGNFFPDSGYDAAQTFLQCAQPPTAIFALNDMMAMGVLSFMYDRNIRVPQDMSVVGFDDITMAAYAVPSLTTVTQPKYALGQYAAELLLRRVQGDTSPLMNIILPTTLTVRKSSAPPPRPIRSLV